MALTIDPKITFNGEEAREGILDPAFERPELTEQFTIVEDIVAKKQIAFLNRIDKVTKLDAGCGTGKQDKALPMEEKFWDPVKMKIWAGMCADEIEGTFWIWLSNKGIDRDKVIDVAPFWAEYVMEVFEDAVSSDVQRVAWFADVDADDIAGGGVITNGVDIADYTQLDGFWKQIFAAGGIPVTPIAANAGVSYVAQDTLADDAAFLIFQGMFNAADSRLRQYKGNRPVLLVTESLFQNWINYKESRNLDMSFVRQDEFFNTDVYRGTKIISMDNVWDKYIRSDFDNGVTWDLPHRALLVTPDTLMLGFDDSMSAGEFRSYFDEESETNNLKGLFRMDACLARDFLVSAAY